MQTLDGISVYYLSGFGDNQKQFTNIDDAIFDFLVKSRNLLIRRPGLYRNVAVLIQLFDYIIKYWNTPQRERALKELEKKERELIQKMIIPGGGRYGLFFQNLSELNGTLNGFNGLGRAGHRIKRQGGWLKRGLNKVREKFDKLVKSNPVNQTKSTPTTLPQIPNDIQIPATTNESAKKTARDFIAKYKVPLAIGTVAAGTGIAIAVSPKLQKKLGLRK